MSCVSFVGFFELEKRKKNWCTTHSLFMYSLNCCLGCTKTPVKCWYNYLSISTFWPNINHFFHGWFAIKHFWARKEKQQCVLWFWFPNAFAANFACHFWTIANMLLLIQLQTFHSDNYLLTILIQCVGFVFNFENFFPKYSEN